MCSSISPWNKIVEGNMIIQYHFLSASIENIVTYHTFWKYTAFYATAFVSPKTILFLLIVITVLNKAQTYF